MSCAAHREAIALLAGDDLARSERPPVEAHLKECAACRQLLAEFRTGVSLLRAAPAAAAPGGLSAASVRPFRRWRKRLPAAIAAVLLAGSLAFPQVRLALAEVLNLPSASVREKVLTWRLPGGANGVTEYVDADYLGMEFRVDPGPGAKVEYVRGSAEARRLVGESLLLPEGPDSCMDSIRVEHVIDGEGLLKYASVETCAYALPPGSVSGSSAAAWYEAQYWPARPTEKLNLVFGANWDVTTRDLTINGRPARVIEATNRMSGEYHSEVWIGDGGWMYKIRNHNPAITLDKVMAVANALH